MPERMILHWEPVLPREQPRGKLDVTWRWTVVVGRDRDCDVVIKQGQIPGKQGQFMRLRNRWFVQDNKVANGIYLSGRRIHFEDVGDAAIDFSMIARFNFERIAIGPEEQQMREAITAGLDDDSRFLVYADWLQERGDELGQLMVSPAPIGARWLGPLFCPGIEVKWRHGFIEGIKIRSAQSIHTKNGAFNEVLAHPLCAFLRDLEVDPVALATENVDFGTASRWVEALFRSLGEDKPRTLRSLTIVNLPEEKRAAVQALLEEAAPLLPALETKWETLFGEPPR